jgi:hypothetical protein
MMPLGGLMVALIAGWALSRSAVRDELGLGDGAAFNCGTRRRAIWCRSHIPGHLLVRALGETP